MSVAIKKPVTGKRLTMLRVELFRTTTMHSIQLKAQPPEINGENFNCPSRGYECELLLDGKHLEGVNYFRVEAKASGEPIQVTLGMTVKEIEVDANAEPVYTITLPGRHGYYILDKEDLQKIVDVLEKRGPELTDE